jgi:hypothetical protein
MTGFHDRLPPDLPCRTNPELWFADPGKSEDIAEAKRLCRTCPVIDACLQYALDHRDRWGVWGGLSAEDRAALKPNDTCVNGHKVGARSVREDGLCRECRKVAWQREKRRKAAEVAA